MSHAEFDRFINTYDEDLAKSLAATGEGRDFYAKGRIDWTAQCIAKLGSPVRQILDYGCGDGANAPMLAETFEAETVFGVDISGLSIATARQLNQNGKLSFREIKDWTPDGSIDLAFTNGVFHHIPVSERRDCLVAIRRALATGGLFAFWENNPWNPGARYVMSQCAFDENAVMISPSEAHRIVREAGFKVLRTDSLFYFPRQLSFLRPTERWLHGLLFGGQYQVLCRRS